MSFHFSLQDSFEIFFQGRSQFLSIWEFLSSLLLGKNSFARYRILAWQVFFCSFSTLNIFACCFWPLKFLNRNRLVIFLRIPLMWWAIFLLLLLIFCLCLWISEFTLLEVCQATWHLYSCLLSNLRSFQSLLILIFPLSTSFWDTHYICVSPLDGVPQVS